MVLVACERSGRVRDAFLERGYDAISADIEDTDVPGPHYKGDVTQLLREPWDMVIAFPPCTRLCLSGVRWLRERDLWADMRAGAEFFLACLDANAPRVAVENPTMHGHARRIVGRGPDFAVQPWMFGHGETKRTCFWTKGLDSLLPTEVVMGRKPRIHRMAPGAQRSRERSATFPGIARAMAEQWGPLLP